MAWPTYAKFVVDGSSEGFDPSVARSEMERGIAKQRVINSDVMVEVSGSVLFQSTADIVSFDTWYFDTIGRIGWFDFTHPRTGAVVTARLVGGRIGDLVPQAGGFAIASRDVKVEYLR
jgi:hypothetical protein